MGDSKSFNIFYGFKPYGFNTFTLNEPQLNSDLEHCEQQQYQDAYPPGFEIQADDASPLRCIECMERAVSSA